MWAFCRLHTPAALPLGNNRRYTLDRRLGESQGRSMCWEDKIVCSCRESNPIPRSPYRRLVPVLTELRGLLNEYEVETNTGGYLGWNFVTARIYSLCRNPMFWDFFFNCCLSVHVDNYTIIVPTKCTSFLLLKAQDITVCTLSLYS
jgi:hypothetical protein